MAATLLVKVVGGFLSWSFSITRWIYLCKMLFLTESVCDMKRSDVLGRSESFYPPCSSSTTHCSVKLLARRWQLCCGEGQLPAALCATIHCLLKLLCLFSAPLAFSNEPIHYASGPLSFDTCSSSLQSFPGSCLRKDWSISQTDL